MVLVARGADTMIQDVEEFLVKTVGFTCIGIGTVFVLCVVIPYLLSVGTIWSILLGLFFLLCPVVTVALFIFDHIKYRAKEEKEEKSE